MKAYKITAIVLDYEGYGAATVKSTIENTKYLNPEILAIEEAEIGKWHDRHPLNASSTREEELARLFPSARVPGTFLVREYQYMQQMAEMFRARLKGESEDVPMAAMDALWLKMTDEETKTVNYFTARVAQDAWTPQHYIAFAETMIVDDPALG